MLKQMVNRKIVELMHKEIEGVISNSEKARLDQHVTNNSSAQKIYQELQSIIKPLNSVNDLDPPSNLKKNIMNAIDLNLYSKVNIRKKNQWSVTRWLFPSNPKLAYAFALGLIFGFFITALWLQEQIQKTDDMKDFYGTIRMSEESGIEKIKESKIDLPQASGSVSIHRLNHYLILDIKIRTSAKFNFILEYNDTEVRFTSFMPLADDKNILELKDKAIVVSGNENSMFRVKFNEINDSIMPIKYKLFISGKLISSQHLIIETENN
jgi:hypothetical protein